MKPSSKWFSRQIAPLPILISLLVILGGCLPPSRESAAVSPVAIPLAGVGRPDATVIILDAINNGKPLPSGVLTLLRPLVLHNREGLTIAGNNTRLVWAGPAGIPMIRFDGVIKMSVRDITVDAGNASVAFLVTSTAEYGSGEMLFSNVHTIGEGTAYQMGSGDSAGEINCADISWSGGSMQNHATGLKVMTYQGVNFHVAGGTALNVGTVWDFTRGGNLDVNGFGIAGRSYTVALHIGVNGGQDNDVSFALHGVHGEDTTLVLAEPIGGCLVQLNGCTQSGGFAPRANYAPAIIASGRGRIIVNAGQFYGPIKSSGDDMHVTLHECLLPQDAVIPPGVKAEGCETIYWLHPIPEVK